jgi:hypothetical protein
LNPHYQPLTQNFYYTTENPRFISQPLLMSNTTQQITKQKFT